MKAIGLKILKWLGMFKKIPRQRLESFLVLHKTDKKVLDIGSNRGPYQHLFPNRMSVDVAPGPNVDIVADAHDLSKIEDNSFEVILCTEVLEHLHTPEKAILEMERVLKPGGKIILTTRFIFPLHDTPHDYYRYTQYGLAHLFHNFHDVKIVEEESTIGTLAVLYERIGLQCNTLGFKPLMFCG